MKEISGEKLLQPKFVSSDRAALLVKNIYDSSIP